MNTSPQTDDKTMRPAINDWREFKMVMKVAGYSQIEFARYIGMSRSHVNNIANGITPLTLRVIEQLRQFLGEPLFTMAVTRARQVIADEYKQQLEHERFWAAEREYQAKQAEEEAERRRQAAIDQLREQLGGGDEVHHADATDASGEHEAQTDVHTDGTTTSPQ